MYIMFKCYDPDHLHFSVTIEKNDTHDRSSWFPSRQGELLWASE